jgi:ribosome-binding protein aMBF1 (putative translation factor)
MSENRHCHKCGWEWALAGLPGRGESCHRCNADLRVCLNCANYDPRAADQCRDRRAEPVLEKQSGNFCEYFDFARRRFVAKSETNPRENTARDQLKKLFGD